MLITCLGEDVETQILDEGVTILWGKLDSEIEELAGCDTLRGSILIFMSSGSGTCVK